MMETTEAEEAWCPPTLRPSRFGRMLLAWWIIHADSQSSLRSSACSRRSRDASSPTWAGWPGAVSTFIGFPSRSRRASAPGGRGQARVVAVLPGSAPAAGEAPDGSGGGTLAFADVLLVVVLDAGGIVQVIDHQPGALPEALLRHV